jgi:hypothetical protein
MKAFVIVTLVFTTAVPAQELLPELLPLAAKYKADSSAIELQRATLISRAKQPYMAALDSAEKNATTSGQLPLVAAVTAERAVLNAGQTLPTSSSNLLKTLQTPRKAYQDETAHVYATFVVKQRRLDADYLRVLASLQSRAAGNPELVKQIEAEKSSLLKVARVTDIRVTSLPVKESNVGYGELRLANDTIAAHAASRVVYDIPPGVRAFSAFGISSDEESKKNGTWRYIVKVDGKKLFVSRALKEFKDLKVPINVSFPVGSKVIELITDPMNDGRSDHSAWASPVFQY